jgi:hypothetical protein
MPLSAIPYTHHPTVLYFKLDLNKKFQYFHVDVCLFGKGVEAWFWAEGAEVVWKPSRSRRF